MGIEPTNAEIARRLEVAEVEVEEMDKRLSKETRRSIYPSANTTADRLRASN